MNELCKDFRAHILSLDIPGCDIAQVDDDHITLTTAKAMGEVNFYSFDDSPEIVELRIVDVDCECEPKFFLHFELTEKSRAFELLQEMVDALMEQELYDTTRVLLCCTAGMTTSMFAAKLTEAARTLSLDYSFEAIPLEQARNEGGAYDAVLLAPQVGYQRKDIAKAFPESVVVEIPAKIFASFDAGGALRMVMHLLSDHTVFQDASNDLKLVRDLKNDKRVMVITTINRPRSCWIGWRIYDHGELTKRGSVTKPRQDPRDIEDLLATMCVWGLDPRELDAIGIAVPGVVNRGTISNPNESVTDYELGRALAERYDTKVFVDNNANAAAVGCYVSQDDYDSVVLYTQQTGYMVGGEGVVADGQLLKGRRNFVGELRPLFCSMHTTNAQERESDLAWSAEGMRSLVTPILVANVSLLAPDAIYVAVDLLDDMGALRDAMLPYFTDGQRAYLPDLVRVTDYHERIALGELALCLQKLANPRPHRKH